MKPRFAVFVRPWLGFGGADRLAIDAALALQAAGWRVEMWVNECRDPEAIAELTGGRLTLRVDAAEAWGEFTRFRLGKNIARQRRLLRRLRANDCEPDLLVCDAVVHVAAWMRRDWPRARVLVYCHFPDALFPGSWSWPHRVYRWAAARLEERGLAAAHRVLVNSSFTREAVRNTFVSLRDREIAVVRPGTPVVPVPPQVTADAEKQFLVLGRFDPLKNLPLAVEALGWLREQLSREEFARCRLVFAGGYDERRPEVVALVERLKAEATRRGVADRVSFVFNPNVRELERRWVDAFALVHPATEEHFGIVLIEAMMRGRPVLAVNAAGPREIVVDGITGVLCEPTAAEFGAAMRDWLRDPVRVERMGRAARERAVAEFSEERFARAFVREAEQTVRES